MQAARIASTRFPGLFRISFLDYPSRDLILGYEFMGRMYKKYLLYEMLRFGRRVARAHFLEVFFRREGIIMANIPCS